jgi:hypothetical protein
VIGVLSPVGGCWGYAGAFPLASVELLACFIAELEICTSERICGGNDVSGFDGFCGIDGRVGVVYVGWFE